MHIRTDCFTWMTQQASSQLGVFLFRRIPFRRMLCKLFFPSFPFLIPFINAIQLFMGVNEMRVKILPLLCRLGLVSRLGSV